MTAITTAAELRNLSQSDLAEANFTGSVARVTGCLVHRRSILFKSSLPSSTSTHNCDNVRHFAHGCEV